MSALAKLRRVYPFAVALTWPDVADRLRAAYRRTDLGAASDLERDVLSGAAVLWVAHSLEAGFEAAAVTKLENTDANRVCVITACGGSDMSRWLDHLAGLEAWAKAMGATKMRIYGRKGWARKLEHYRISNVVLERSL